MKTKYQKSEKNIGIIFQSFYLIPNYTALENVTLILELNKSKSLLDRFGLKHRLNNLPSQLSVSLSRELFSKADTYRKFRLHVKEESSSLIMVTHDPKLANRASMEKLNKFYQYKFILIYALRDLKRNYKKISSIIITLFNVFHIKCNIYY